MGKGDQVPERGRKENAIEGHRQSGERDGSDESSSLRSPYTNVFDKGPAKRETQRISLDNGATLITEGGRTAVEFPFGTKLTVDLHFNPPVMAQERGSMVSAKHTATLLSMPPADVFAYKNGGRLVAYENGWGSFSFAGDAGTGIEYDMQGVRSVTCNGKTIVLRQEKHVLPSPPPIQPNREYTI